MAKITIQQKPTFDAAVEIPRIGDKPIKVNFTFAYLDRAQLAEFEDAGIANEKSTVEYLQQDDRTLSAYNSAVEEGQVSQLKKIIKAWGFDDEFNDANLSALVRSAASVPAAIFAAYREAYQKAREGN